MSESINVGTDVVDVATFDEMKEKLGELISGELQQAGADGYKFHVIVVVTPTEEQECQCPCGKAEGNDECNG